MARMPNENPNYYVTVDDNGYQTICPTCGVRFDPDPKLVRKERWVEIKPCCGKCDINKLVISYRRPKRLN